MSEKQLISINLILTLILLVLSGGIGYYVYTKPCCNCDDPTPQGTVIVLDDSFEIVSKDDLKERESTSEANSFEFPPEAENTEDISSGRKKKESESSFFPTPAPISPNLQANKSRTVSKTTNKPAVEVTKQEPQIVVPHFNSVDNRKKKVQISALIVNGDTISDYNDISKINLEDLNALYESYPELQEAFQKSGFKDAQYKLQNIDAVLEEVEQGVGESFGEKATIYINGNKIN